MSNPIIFDGIAAAAAKEHELLVLSQQVQAQGIRPKIAAILFREDKGSVLYTGLKREAAARLGIGYSVSEFSLTDSPALVGEKIQQLNADASITGIIIQKPWQRTWIAVQEARASVTSESPTDSTMFAATPAQAYAQWWQSLVAQVDPTKDVDGLTPSTLKLIVKNQWHTAHRVLPATCQAVLSIMDEYSNLFFTNNSAGQGSGQIAIIGRSDLLGMPLFWVLKHRGCDVILLGKKELKQGIEQKNYLHGFKTIISATGISGLVTGELVDEGVCFIDVGEPKGDLNFTSLAKKARFITPVPGGVGPMTVISLMANCLQLCRNN